MGGRFGLSARVSAQKGIRDQRSAEFGTSAFRPYTRAVWQLGLVGGMGGNAPHVRVGVWVELRCGLGLGLEGWHWGKRFGIGVGGIGFSFFVIGK